MLKDNLAPGYLAKILVITNSPNSNPGRFGDWLSQVGIDCQVHYGGNGLPDTMAGYDGLMVLGGSFTVNKTGKELNPWLPQTITLLRQAVAAKLPTLGICLGGQLLALAMNGSVKHGQLPPEIGMTKIKIEPDAEDDPLFSTLLSFGTIVMAEHHHSHVTALPAGAILLASSQRAPIQAFNVGGYAWGVQFHPEVSREEILNWNLDIKREAKKAGFDWNQIMDDATTYDADNTYQSQLLANRFAQIIIDQRAKRQPSQKLGYELI